MTVKPKYEVIKELIRESIKDGTITNKLPGERALAKKYEVSYMTVRRAVTELVEAGILHKLATKGTFVSDSKTTPKVTHNIGFFLDKKIKEGVSSPYYSLIFNALEKEVQKKGYHLVLFSELDDLNPILSKKKIDGVIMSCFPRIEGKIQELKKSLPIVLLDNISSDKSIPSVTVDNFNGSYAAVDYLCSLGHKRIAFISGLLDSDICKERLLGYSQALQNNNIKEDKSLIFKGDYSFESGEKAATYFLKQKRLPTAIMCANDSMAIGAMKIVREAGLEIPKDMSIIGFDNIAVSSKVFPTLTTVGVPISEIAARSVEMVLSLINGENVDYQHAILPATLLNRNSCSTPNKK
jgi:DNA-binding LacI/PurR family transcriptional regulator